MNDVPIPSLPLLGDELDDTALRALYEREMAGHDFSYYSRGAYASGLHERAPQRVISGASDSSMQFEPVMPAVSVADSRPSARGHNRRRLTLIKSSASATAAPSAGASADAAAGPADHKTHLTFSRSGTHSGQAAASGSPAAAPAKPYSKALDGLRAICAIGVIFYHMNMSWCQGGLLGVTILFVLSGYLATSGLLKEFAKSGTINVMRYWVRRIWRLMPTVIAFVVVTSLLMAIFNHALLTKMRPDIVPGIFMYINWAKIFSNESYFAAAGAPSPLTHFWSLAIEAQFYVIWPLVLLAALKLKAPRRGIRIGLIVVTLASAALMAYLYVPGEDPSRPYYGTDTRAMSLTIGCWLAFVLPFDKTVRIDARTLSKGKKALVNVGGWVCTLALVAMMLFTEGYTSFSYYGGILACSVITVGAIAATVPQGTVLARILSVKPLEWIGKRSYAIYLWHFPILELLNKRNSTTPLAWWVVLLELALIFVIAELSYRFIEMPWRNGVPKRKRRGSKVERAQLEAAGKEYKEEKTSPLQDFVTLVKHAPFVTAACGGLVIASVACCVAIPPVTVNGDNPEDKVLTQASLRRPLAEGTYDVVLIGDSVSLGANDQLNEMFPQGLIDSAGGRQWFEALDTYIGYRDAGVVGDTVIFGVGTNGQLLDDDIDAMMAEISPDKHVWFITVRGPAANYLRYNEAIWRAAERYSNVGVIDWYGASEGHDDYVSDDGIHLNGEGRNVYANLIYTTIDYKPLRHEDTVYPVTLVGSTACMDAAERLAANLPQWMIDVADVRDITATAERIKLYSDQKVLGPDVVVNVGNLKPFTANDLEPLYDALVADGDTTRRLWVINGRSAGSWCQTNNALVAQFCDKHANVQLINWYGASEGHDEYLTEDGDHLTQEGINAYITCIMESMGV